MDVIEEAERLAEYVIETCSSASGLLVEKIDLKTDSSSGKCMVNDLGDYVPFFYWLGEKTDRKYCRFAEEQVRLAVKCCMMPSGFFDFGLDKNSRGTLKSDLKLINVSEQGDAILGLVGMYELVKRQEFRGYVEDFFAALEKHAISREGLVYSHVIPALKLRVPLSAGTYSGVFLEELARFYQLTGEEKYLRAAKEIAGGWLGTEFFKKFGLFSFETVPSMFATVAGKAFEMLTKFNTHTAMLMKSNTNLMFGILKLYSLTGEDGLKNAVYRWIENLNKKLTDDKGRFYLYWDGFTGEPSLISLEANHAVIDVLLEAYLLFDEKGILAGAERCAEAWQGIQGETGLVPNGVEGTVPVFDMTGGIPRRVNVRAHVSRLDSQTDFAVVLLKLYSLTRREKYLEDAERVLGGILKYHRFRNGYVEFVDLKTGEKSGLALETKFLTLLLKLFLLYSEIEEGKDLVHRERLKNLVRDR